MIGTAEAGINGAHALADFAIAGRIGSAGEHVDDGFRVVTVVVSEGADDGQLVGVLSEKWKIAAEREAGNPGFDFAGDARIGRGSVEIRVESFDVARATAEKE